ENTLRDRHKWFTARRRAAALERPLPPSTVLTLRQSTRRGETPSRRVDRDEKEAWVRLALDLLDDEPRELIVLHEWEGLPFAEIGARIGTTEDAARMRYQRAVAKLALKIGELRRGEVESAVGGDAGDEER
ncbi:MAG TPA: sigma-70 family RNA polymerase sigma factor, partial [Planctomycetota bacterium]|nr:sigma-70 family RNA polymerase sigma factor [Planctomycetota bacterium]